MTSVLKYSLLKWRPDRLHRHDGAVLLCTSAKKPEGRRWKRPVNFLEIVLEEIISNANARFSFFVRGNKRRCIALCQESRNDLRTTYKRLLGYLGFHSLLDINLIFINLSEGFSTQ